MTGQDHSTEDQKPLSTGSQSSGEPVFLAVGKLRKPHGIRGEIEMEVLTDYPERIRKGVTVYLGDDHQPLVITSHRWKDQVMLLAFEGFPVREEVAQLRNQVVFVRSAGLPDLPEGEYYHHQLLGLQVVDDSGIILGKLVDILETGANDVYLVRSSEGRESLLPAVEDVILKVDLENRTITVRPQQWE